MKRFLLSFLGLSLLLPTSALAKTPNDPFLLDTWYLNTIRAYDAWDITTGSRDIVVAVLDTGVDLNHPDLMGNIWTNSGEIPNDGIDNDLNGYIDDVHGWDFVDKDNVPEPNINEAVSLDAISHGTLIAGVIAAIGNNGEGVAGISWQSKIMPVRILDNVGSGETWHARQAIRYAIAMGADVINLSFTGFDYDADFENAVREAYEAGVVVVAALGNSGSGGVDVNLSPIYPACFVGPNGEDYVLGITASDKKDTKAGFSNFGSNCADLAAPGVDMFGTVFQDETFEEIKRAYAGGWSGTSIATPLVSGTVVLLKSVYPTLTPTQIKTVLQLSVDPVLTGNAPLGSIGSGRLNVSKALNIAASFAPKAAVVPPIPVIPPVSLVTPTTPIEPPKNILSPLVFGASSGEEPWVKVMKDSGEEETSFLAYSSSFRGGVRVAVGDVDGDGTNEIVTVAGPGGGPHVRIFNFDGSLKSHFFAGDSTDRSGLFVTVGDMDSDGYSEVIVSEDAKATGEVRCYNSAGQLKLSFFPFGKTESAIRVAAGDLEGDITNEIVVSRGAGFAPLVKIFNNQGISIREFLAYAETYDKGVFVATGDTNGDGVDEIITGTDFGGGPHVRVFSADGTVKGSFFAYDKAFRGGVRVGVQSSITGFDRIVTVPGPGGGPHVRSFTTEGAVLQQFFLPVPEGDFGRFIGA